MRRTELLAQLKDALDRLYDPVHLRDHPIAHTLHLSSASPHTRAESLRQLLWDAVEALRPADGLPSGRAEWSVYHVLRLRYLHAMQPSEVQDELGLSPATYYRRQSEGLDALVRVLSDRTLDDHSIDAAGAAPLTLRAPEEALRVARESERQLVSIPQLIAELEHTVRRLAQAREIGLTVSADPSLPSVYASPAMLHLIVVNLLMEVVERVGSDSLLLSVRAEQQNVRWCLSPLPEPAPHGAVESAEGLRVCQGLLHFYGGRLELGRDDLGRPALLWQLPIARPRSVLVIEDSDETIELYQRYLAGRNYTVYAASSLAEIRARLDETVPDVILLDVVMPGVDGWTILESVKTAKHTAHVPVVVCSILGRPGAASALGASEVLAKPFSQQDLLRVLDRLLEDNPAGMPRAPRE